MGRCCSPVEATLDFESGAGVRMCRAIGSGTGDVCSAGGESCRASEAWQREPTREARSSQEGREHLLFSNVSIGWYRSNRLAGHTTRLPLVDSKPKRQRSRRLGITCHKDRHKDSNGRRLRSMHLAVELSSIQQPILQNLRQLIEGPLAALPPS